MIAADDCSAVIIHIIIETTEQIIPAASCVANQFIVPEKILSIPMAAINRPITLVITPKACFPTYFTTRSEFLRIAQVISSADTLEIITVSIPNFDESKIAVVITPGPVVRTKR